MPAAAAFTSKNEFSIELTAKTPCKVAKNDEATIKP